MLKKFALTGLIVLANKTISLYKMEISLAELQSAIEKLFPINRKKYLLSLTLVDPIVRLDGDSNRIGIEFTAQLDTPGDIQAAWRGVVYGSPSYQRRDGELYLLNLTIQRTNSDGDPKSPMSIAYSILETMLNSVFSNTPVLRLQEDNLKHALARLLLKSVTVGEDKLILELSLY